jgi:hypothetical protein
MMFPAKMKKGTARKENDWVLEKNLCAATETGIFIDKMYTTPESPMENAIGRPMATNVKNPIIIIQIIFEPHHIALLK